jgi:ferredoxin
MYNILGGNDMKRKAVIDKSLCVACGCYVKVCPKSAISVPYGINAVIDETLCVGCGKCAKECPASVITLEERNNES